MEIFFRRVYTIAFRLTGEKEIAGEIATSAIINTIIELSEDYKVIENSFKLTILELIKIFLNTPTTHYNDSFNEIQNALLKLKPLNRAIIIWKDVLGYKVSDNIPIVDYSYDELLRELICGRKELKDYISLENFEAFEMLKETDLKY